MNLIQLPQWNGSEPIWYGLLAVNWILFWILEATGSSPIRYSKFRKGHGISTRTGMLVLYGGPLLFGLGYLIYMGESVAPAAIAASILLILHFAKRVLETLFVHRYSGPIDWNSTIQICASYTLGVWVIQFTSQDTICELDSASYLGILLFVVGSVGNFYHHRILASLRKDGDSSYRVPSGGLFPFVTCPHYLFEILAWLGIALVSKQLATYINLMGMTVYLAMRSRKTLIWYREKFASFPTQTKAMIPFVF